MQPVYMVTIWPVCEDSTAAASKATAAREVEAMLAGIIVEGTPSFSLVQSKE